MRLWVTWHAGANDFSNVGIIFEVELRVTWHAVARNFSNIGVVFDVKLTTTECHPPRIIMNHMSFSLQARVFGFPCWFTAMSIDQATLQGFWHTSAPNRLTPWQQALALGLREASKELNGGHVALSWIASKLRKTDSTGKAYSTDPPKHGSLSEFFSQDLD